MNKQVLLIEDDIQMSALIAEYLLEYGFTCKEFHNPKEAIEELRHNPNYDAIILDLMLPHMDGFDVFKKLKSIHDIPILISSARGDIGNKILGFELGADDYMAKPYEPRELVLRLEYILKRQNNSKIVIGNFIIDKPNRGLYIDNYPIELTKIEFEIFIFLIENINKNLSREQILHATSLDLDTKSRTIDTHISNIRHKIGDDSKEQRYIKSIWGIGYKFVGE